MSTREKLAAYAHEAWCGWMQYLFGKSATNADGSVTIPPVFVRRWLRQIGTAYVDLSEAEKDSDRAEADKMISVIGNTWKPATEPPDTMREVVVAMKWHQYDGRVERIVTAAAYYPDVKMWTMAGEVINDPDEVLYWQELPELPEGLQ